MLNLTRQQLCEIANYANVFKIMGEKRWREVTVDYVPGRQAIVLPRLPDDDALNALPPHVEELVFKLEDAMFGGELFAALTCKDLVIVAPFVWTGWDSLAQSSITW